MINRIIDICAKNKFLVLLFVGVAVLIGWHSLKNTKLDAIPDLSDTQVIVYSKWDRSPDIMEDQVTYPITSALLGLPKVKDIRGFSDFGYSYVYIIFEEGTDIYWARSRTLEYLNSVVPRLPKGVSVELAKNATAVVGSISMLWSIPLGNTALKRYGATRIGICATPCSPCPVSPKSPP
jgi:Cu(I)/Ag(I) efflux system membrane protein CusA/SilA